MHAQQMPTHSLTLVTVVDAKRQAGSLTASVHDAILAAGLEDAKSLTYTAVPEDELLVAEGLDVEVDGRSEPHARSLNRKYHADGERYGTAARIPPHDFEDAFGLEAEEVTNGGIQLALYAGDGVIALGRLPIVEFDAEALDDG